MSEFESCMKCKHTNKTENDYPCNQCKHCIDVKDHYKPMTNADRIRNMTDEELAEFLSKTVDDIVSCDGCDEPINEYGSCSGNCKNPYLKWLQAEAKGDSE